MKILVPYENIDVAHVYNRNAVALIGVREFLTLEEGPEGNGVFVEIRGVEEINQELAVKLQREEEAILVLTPTEVLYSDYRHLLERLAELNIKNRVIIRAVASGEEIDDLNLRVAAHVGGLFIDRQGYGLWLVILRRVALLTPYPLVGIFFSQPAFGAIKQSLLVVRDVDVRCII